MLLLSIEQSTIKSTWKNWSLAEKTSITNFLVIYALAYKQVVLTNNYNVKKYPPSKKVVLIHPLEGGI
jgi:hypothetical protein